jgi:hypothetical protein
VELQILRSQKLNAQKRASKWKIRATTAASSGQVNDLKGQISYLENEKCRLVEVVVKFIYAEDVTTFFNGKYDSEVRAVYMDLMSKGVSSKNCASVIRVVLKQLAGNF